MRTNKQKLYLLLATATLVVAAGSLISSTANGGQQENAYQRQEYSVCVFYGRAYKHGVPSETIGWIGALSRTFPITLARGDWDRIVAGARSEWLNSVRARLGDDVDGDGSCAHFPTLQEASEFIDSQTSDFRHRDAQVVSIEFAAHAAPVADCDGVPAPCTAPGYLTWDGPGGLERARLTAHFLFDAGRFADLDALIDRYSKLQDRLTDGRFKLSGIAQFLTGMFGSGVDEAVLEKARRWRTLNPKSAGAALLEAEYWSNAAWKARGSGYGNSVSPEGWQLFRERLERAHETLVAAEPYASENPLWYMQSLEVNLGLGVPLKAQFSLYEQGLKAFPGYFNLHFAMIRFLRPEWYGSNPAIAAFIAAVLKGSPPCAQAELYTRLWWFTVEGVEDDVDIFRDLEVSWPQMKKGFDSLVKSNPDSAWIRSSYAAYACQAHDMMTFTRLRGELGHRIEGRAFRSNISIDVCDARANGKPV